MFRAAADLNTTGMEPFTFIDVSGLGNSGKSAVVDFLREIDGVYVPPYWFELDIIRTPDGLLDLRHHLLTDWSTPRSHHAVEAFIHVAERMGANPAWWNLAGHMRATGHRYDRFFQGRFVTLSRAFARGFVRGSIRADWPFDFQYQTAATRLARKFLRKSKINGPLRSSVLLATGEDFDHRARIFLNALFEPVVLAGTRFIVMNNAFEPFSPVPGLDMLDARQIVVTRDPRDIYVSGQDPAKLRKQGQDLAATERNYGLHSRFLATDDLSIFVLRQRIYRDQLYKGSDPRILQVRFEDMVENYEATAAKILSFLQIDPAQHTHRGSQFRPQASAGNLGIWKRYSGHDELAYIAREMGDILASD